MIAASGNAEDLQLKRVPDARESRPDPIQKIDLATFRLFAGDDFTLPLLFSRALRILRQYYDEPQGTDGFCRRLLHA